MGAIDEVEILCPPNSNPLDIDKEWRRKALLELNEDPNKARENMKLLAKMLQEDEKIYSRTDDTFLMAFLRGKKHDVEGAYKLIKSYYGMKHKYPEFYRDCIPSERGYIYDMAFLNLIHGVDKNGRQLCIVSTGKMDFSQISIEEVFQLGGSIFETALMNPEIQISGICVILDMIDLTLIQQARLVNPKFAWQLTNCIQEKIPVRIGAIHVVNQPVYYTALYAIFKPFLKQKLRKRLHFHGADMQSLHNFISPEYLPSEFGGKRGPSNPKAVTKMVKQNEHNLIEWRKYGVRKC